MIDWRRLCFLVHVFHWLAVFVATSAGAEIVGPDRVEPYSLARYTATGGERSSYAWTVHPIGSASVEVVGDRLIFTGKPGKYTLQLTEVGPTGDEARPFFIQQTFRDVLIGQAPPEPGPEPGPGPTPDPTPDPAPFACDGLHVLIVYESSTALDPRHGTILYGKGVRTYLDAACKNVAGTAAYRIWDKDVDVSEVEQTWRDAMAVSRDNLPWLVVSNGKAGYSGPLPHGPEAFQELVKKYEVK